MRPFYPPSLDEADRLFRAIREARTSESLAPLFDKLLAEQPLLGYALGRGSFFWRGRRCSSAEGWPNVLDLAYPPPEIARADRLNDTGDPILYASTRALTVLDELHAEPGDYIHLIGIRIKQGAGVHFMSIGDFFHIFKAGFSRIAGSDWAEGVGRVLNDMGVENARRVIYIDAFLSEVLADPVASQTQYLQTRALRYAVFRKIKAAEGFFYPSVQDRIGMNLAIKPDTFDAKGQIIASQVIQVSHVRQFGLYDYRCCRHAKWFEPDGTFVWLPPDEPHELVIFGMTEEEERFCREKGDIIHGNEFFDFMRTSLRAAAPK
jgi:hypothetical protein